MTTEQETHELTMARPSDREVSFERMLDFPRDMVWKAYTDPDLIGQWYGGGLRVETMDVRPGGLWKFVADRPGGSYAFEGEYLEVDPPRKLVQTSRNGWTGMTTTETVQLDDLGGNRTRLTLTSNFSTAQELENMMSTGVGMDVGVKYQLGQLTQMLMTMSNSGS